MRVFVERQRNGRLRYGLRANPSSATDSSYPPSEDQDCLCRRGLGPSPGCGNNSGCRPQVSTLLQPEGPCSGTLTAVIAPAPRQAPRNWRVRSPAASVSAASSRALLATGHATGNGTLQAGTTT